MRIKDYDTKLTNERLKLHETIRFLTDNPIREFQVDNAIRIESVTITIKDGAIKSVQSKLTPLIPKQ